MTSELNRYYSYVINGRSRRWFLNALEPTDDDKIIAQIRDELEQMQEGFDRLRRLVERIEKEQEGKE
jgi:hypothetical protein